MVTCMRAGPVLREPQSEWRVSELTWAAALSEMCSASPGTEESAEWTRGEMPMAKDRSSLRSRGSSAASRMSISAIGASSPSSINFAARKSPTGPAPTMATRTAFPPGMSESKSSVGRSITYRYPDRGGVIERDAGTQYYVRPTSSKR